MLHDGGCSPVSSMGSHKEVEDIAPWGHSPMVSLPSIPGRLSSGIPGRCLSGNAQAQSLSLSSRPPTQGPQFSQSLGRTLTLPAVLGQFSEVFWRTVAPWWLNGRIHGLMEYKGSSRLHTPQDLGTGTPHTSLLSRASGGQHRYCREHDGSHIHVLGTCVNCASYDLTAQRSAAAESFTESFGPLPPSHTRTHTPNIAIPRCGRTARET